MNLPFARFRLHLFVEDELSLPPYKGSAFRGGLGAAFKRAVCIYPGKECPSCQLKNGCSYAYIFETSHLPQDNPGERTSNDPHPFIIEPPSEVKQRYLPGDELCCHLILIGKGIDYLAYFILAFAELGTIGIGKGRGKFQLAKVENIAADGSSRLIYDGETLYLSHPLEIKSIVDIEREAGALNPNRITLQFTTPTRIKSGGKLIREEMSFDILMHTLLRRLSWLAELHCEQKWQLDYKDMLLRAKESVSTAESRLFWYDWERYSSRQNARLKMGGFIGKISFEGGLREFLPLLKLGEYLHIGKGTVYGLGKYRLY